jgi:uncharacterized protein YndB with AHSA1/START domain
MSSAGPNVSRSIDLDAPASAVWEAITDPYLLQEWLADEVELDPEAGGELACRAENGEQRRGTVERSEHGELLVFTWGAPGEALTRVELAIEALPDTTRLTVTETRLEAGGPAPRFEWSARLESLRLCLASLAYA